MLVSAAMVMQLDEALQQAQLDKAIKQLVKHTDEPEDKVRDDLLGAIAQADPTVKDDPLKGKYAGWLVRIITNGLKDITQSDWIEANPEEAFEQGLLTSLPRSRRELSRTYADTKSAILGGARQAAHVRRAKGIHNSGWWKNQFSVETLGEILSRFHELASRNWLKPAGVSNDINDYNGIDHLEGTIAEIGGPVAHVIENPGDLDFDVAYMDKKNGVYVFRTQDEDTAVKLGEDTSWCFGYKGSYSSFYTERGNIYVLFVRKGYNAPRLRTKPSSLFVDLDVAVAASPHSGEDQETLEIQDASGRDIEPHDLTSASPSLLEPIVDSLQMELDAGYAKGFDSWMERGTIEPTPEEWRELVNDFGLEVDNDGDAHFRLNPDRSIVDKSNMNVLEGEDGVYVSGDHVYIGPSADVDTIENARKALVGEIIDMDAFSEVENEVRDELWANENEYFIDEIEKAIPEEGLLGISQEEWADAAHDISSVSAAYEIADLAQADLFEFDDYGGIVLDTDIPRRLDLDNRKVAIRLRNILGLKSPEKEAFEKEVAGGQQFFKFAPPEEFKFESLRAAMRKVMLGRVG